MAHTYRPPSQRPGGPATRTEATRRALQGATQALKAALRLLDHQATAELLDDEEGQARALQRAAHATSAANLQIHRALSEVAR